MTAGISLRALTVALRWLPLLMLLVLIAQFGALSPRFLSPANLSAILTQASWLVVLALGVNFVLLTAGVDLSIGAIMYLAVALITLVVPGLPLWLWLPAALILGAAMGLLGAGLIVRAGLPAFIATLALAFILRGAGLWLSDTQMILAPDMLASLGRATLFGVSLPLLLALVAFAFCWGLLNLTPFGMYIRAIGADPESARRAGIPRGSVLLLAYGMSGALAGMAGLMSFAQTAAATAAFGLNAEFLAIAAAVLGGTSLFGGRGSAIAPVAGAILITTVQNGLVMIDANPYAYPVVTGGVIFLAAFLDSVRARIMARLERPRILAIENATAEAA